MTMLHAYIPQKLMEKITISANCAGVNKSEFVRLALEYVQERNIQIVQKMTFRDE